MAGEGGSMNFNTSFSDISSGLFGADTNTTQATNSSTTKKSDITQSEKLNIDEVGLLRLIDRALQGEGGLASIFGGEAGAGLFGSSSAKMQTEDLLAKIAGELAIVTGEKVATNVGEETTDTKSSSEQTSESGGILDSLGFGGIL